MACSPVSWLLPLLCLSLKNRLDRSRTAAHRTSAVGQDGRCCSCWCSPDFHRRTCTYHLSAIIMDECKDNYALCFAGLWLCFMLEKFISFYVPTPVITQSDYKKHNKLDVRFLFVEACVLTTAICLAKAPRASKLFTWVTLATRNENHKKVEAALLLRAS